MERRRNHLSSRPAQKKSVLIGKPSFLSVLWDYSDSKISVTKILRKNYDFWVDTGQEICYHPCTRIKVLVLVEEANWMDQRILELLSMMTDEQKEDFITYAENLIKTRHRTEVESSHCPKDDQG